MNKFKDNFINKNSNKSDKRFLDDYYSRYQKILFDSRDDNSILKLRNAIYETNLNKGKLIFIGNGASASLASHAATDFTKQAKIPSIAFNDHNLITALSNDYGYRNWVAKAIEFYSVPNDMVIFISVSGESSNLLEGIDFAKKRALSTASLTGASKTNSLKKKSEYSLWVNSKAYNIVESIHTIWITLIIDLFVGSPEYIVNT
tara:strand:- start:1843 stop:2451 length:609 start_codon:yes stop_codon:yes gene_type:complete